MTSASGQACTAIIIPSAGVSLAGEPEPMLKRCLESFKSLHPAPLEVLVVIGDEYQGLPVENLTDMAVSVIHRGPGPFDFSQAINAGVLTSSAEQVLILNDDVVANGSDWLERLASNLQDPTVGIVGATLLYPDKSIQHIGIEFVEGQPIHSFRGSSLSNIPAERNATTQDVDAVTGACMLTRRSTFLAVGGISRNFPISYGDIDLCLRLKRCGLRIVLDPTVMLTHYESASRPAVIEKWEQERFKQRWSSNPLQLLQTAPHIKSTDAPVRWSDPDVQKILKPCPHELLDLKERNIAQAVQLEQLKLHAKHLTNTLFENEKIIREWKDRVSERDTRIAERDTRIAERDTRIAERDTRIAERDTRIAERDTRIAANNLQIAELDTHLKAQAAHIAKQDAENLRLHQNLARPLVIRLLQKIFRR